MAQGLQRWMCELKVQIVCSEHTMCCESPMFARGRLVGHHCHKLQTVYVSVSEVRHGERREGNGKWMFD